MHECEECSNGFGPVFEDDVIVSCVQCPFNCKTCLDGVCLECR